MIDDWLLIADYWLLIADCWLLIIDYWCLIADYWLLSKYSIQGIPPSVGTFAVPTMGYDNGSVFVFTLDWSQSYGGECEA